MERTLLGSTVSTLNGTIASAWNGLRGKASPQPIRTMIAQSYAAYSTKDLFKRGQAIVQLYAPGSSPISRDFTETELTDGTYTAWVGSNTPYVAKLYDQIGSNDIFNAFNGTQPKYTDTDNTVFVDKSGYFGNYRTLTGTSSDAIENNFGGNDVGDEVTFFVNAKTNTGTAMVGHGPYFAVIDNAPTIPANQRSKGIGVDSTENISARWKDQGYTEFNADYDNALTGTLQNFTTTQFRSPTIADTTTFELYRAGVKEKTVSTDTMDTGTLRVRQFSLGGVRASGNIFLAYNRRLSELEVAKLEREITAL